MVFLLYQLVVDYDVNLFQVQEAQCFLSCVGGRGVPFVCGNRSTKPSLLTIIMRVPKAYSLVYPK